MKATLLVNVGSETLKYCVVSSLDNFHNKKLERRAIYNFFFNHVIERKLIYHNKSLAIIKKAITKIAKTYDISVVGHRIVHGYGKKSCTVSSQLIRHLDNIVKLGLAPLHNPMQTKVLKVIKHLLPHAKHYALFDSDIYADIPQYNKLYAIPITLSKKYKIFRYGFHGLNHYYVANIAAMMLNKPLNKLNIITAHIGGGCSITAFKQGKAIDTTMGFTPLEGCMMVTRAGSIDPSIVLFLLRLGFSHAKIEEILNMQSGIYGITGTRDFIRVLELVKNKHKNNKNKKVETARLGFEMLVSSVAKHILAIASNLEKIDALVFTAGIGENSNVFRRAVCDKLKVIGINIDTKSNVQADMKIESQTAVRISKTKPYVFVIKQNEEAEMVARLLELQNLYNQKCYN